MIDKSYADFKCDMNALPEMVKVQVTSYDVTLCIDKKNNLDYLLMI